MPIIQKTPYDVDNYYVDFTAQLNVNMGETISSFAVKAINAYDQSDATATIIGPVAATKTGNIITFWYQAGQSNTHYIVQVQIVTSTGRKLEADVDILVMPEVSA